ncbi:hypothetical protein [Geobacter sp. AOG1]|uniref:hypothetical protein n=1 Tax=Geobacter sp. AOG1 TaxID=1566346 RepID=UPI001CC542A4|nr:hypothetical protein [Geobacter sp. AOG1]GFE56246.1 hypothetical protein AOG1_01240 [Geobacter sp. AOG1]
MKSLLSMFFVALFAAFMLTACVVTPGPGGYGVEVAPALPAVIELDVAQPYYYQSGYYYFYQGDRWNYSRSRSGPWAELPRSHWPKEIRQRGREERGGEFRREREER